MPNERSLTATGYFICRAENRHLSALNAIELAAATLFPPKVLPEPILTDCLPLEVLVTAKNTHLLWVAVDAQDCPVGYVLLQIVDGLALVAQLDVHPLHGRKGLGTVLMRHGIRYIQAMGFDALYLTTFLQVEWNAPFYKTLGFKVMDEGDVPDAIVQILCKERACGLNNRVAMKVSLPVS